MKKIMFNDRYGLTNAVLSGRKTQTRRIEFDEYLQTEASDADAIGYGQGCCQVWRDGKITRQIPSLYKVGEVVAVAQAYKNCINEVLIMQGYKTDIATLAYKKLKGWDNKMFVRADFMPHRIRITGIRVERLQDISDEDCIKEGIRPHNHLGCYHFEQYGTGYYFDSPREAYAELIDKVSGNGTWESNPYVFVYDFELIK